jgi:SAM-dependent methyltransferase
VIDLLKAGEVRKSLALAALGEFAASSAWRLVEGSAKLDLTRSIGSRLWRWRERVWAEQAARMLFGEDGNEPALPDLLRLVFLRLRRNREQFNYNYYRYSMPRHLVALSFIQSITLPQRQPVLDLACGAGHITRAVEEHVRPTPVIGLDHQFLSLYLARRIAPAAHYVCGDATALPFRDRSYGIAISTDAFSAIDRKSTVLRELVRVTSDDGESMLINLRNRLRPHPYPSRDLSPRGYEELAGHLDHRLIPDGLTLERYLKGLGPAAAAQVEMPELDEASRFSLLVRKPNSAPFADHGRFDGWPHARGELAVNPLYALRSKQHEELAYEVHYPSDFYEAENAEADAYLPPRFTLDERRQDALSRGSTQGLEELISRCAILGLPPAYRTPDGFVADRDDSRRTSR